MKINSNDIEEMRKLEESLCKLRDERDQLYFEVECERITHKDASGDFEWLIGEIDRLELELDIVGGFNGE
jgi:hypothetical protein